MLAISAKNLTKIYKKNQLFKSQKTLGIEDLSLDINEGEVFGLLGLNGSGKTTTIKLVLGLLVPTSGDISVFGNRVPDKKTLQTIGYLPEVPYFYRYLSATEILKFYGTLSGVSDLDKKVASTLEVVGLSKWADKKLSEFSKGMVQRIGIAQSLLHDPKLLVYDEPVSGLDPLAVAEIRDLIIKLKSMGKTVFLSSHMISEVEKTCDRAAILVKGRLARVIGRKDWSAKEGGLEGIFVNDAKDSSEVGRIKI